MERKKNRLKDLFAYNPYKTIEERIWHGVFWFGILFFIVWVEICMGIAVAKLLMIFN
jgi:hypothetical protein